MPLAQRLKTALELTKGRVTEATIADVCNISRQAVDKWFDGKTKHPKSLYLFKVARLCEVDPEWLMLGVGVPRSASLMKMVEDNQAKDRELAKVRAQLAKMQDTVERLGLEHRGVLPDADTENEAG